MQLISLTAFRSLGTVTGVIALLLSVSVSASVPLAAQDRAPQVPADSVLALPELRV